jgi:hypothetical protein
MQDYNIFGSLPAFVKINLEKLKNKTDGSRCFRDEKNRESLKIFVQFRLSVDFEACLPYIWVVDICLSGFGYRASAL